MNRTVLALVVLLVCGASRPALAQVGAASDVMLRGVPGGDQTDGVMALTLADAVARGLDHNLAMIAAEAGVGRAQGTERRSRADLLPHLGAAVRESAQVVNLAAFGFTGFPGVPEVIGPFGVFDARVGISTALVDVAGLRELESSRASLDVARYTQAETREAVILVVGTLYLEAVTDRARLDAARSQVETARTLLQAAEDQRAAGVAAGIDVLRQQAQLEAATAREIDADNAFEKRKLRLARAIGLPAAQAFELVTAPSYVAAAPVDVESAVASALSSRQDIRAAEARVASAKAARAAAAAAHLPSLHLDADYGRLGAQASTTESTYTVAAQVRIPVFDGGTTGARTVEADADLRQREAELADLRAAARFDVAAALFDLNAAEARVHVAETRRDLTNQELVQAEDRFRAGVTSSIELAEAQNAVAASVEQYIASVEAHVLAKASLARAMGQVEERFVALVGGAR